MSDIFLEGLKNRVIAKSMTKFPPKTMEKILKTAIKRTENGQLTPIQRKNKDSWGSMEIGVLLGENYEQLLTIRCYVDEIIKLSKLVDKSDLQVLSTEFEEALVS